MPIWQDRLTRVRKSLDTNWGDEVRAIPRETSQYSGSIDDASRPQFDFIGLLLIGEGKSSNLDGGLRSSWRARIPTGQAELRVDVSVYPAAEALREGDHIVATNRDGALFEINRIDPDQRNRLVFVLTRL